MKFPAVNVFRPSLSLSYSLAILLFVGIVAAYQAVLGALGFNDLPLFIPFLLAIVISTFSFSRGRRLIGLSLTVATIITALILAGLYDDIFFDGITYHQSGIFWASSNFGFWSPNVDDFWAIFVNHYPKLSWLFGSAFLGPAEFLTYSKSLNWLVLGASFAIAWEAFEQHGKYLRSLAMLAIALNPVTLSQLFSNYVDGVMANLFVLASLSLWLLMTRPQGAVNQRPLVIIFVLSLIFMAGLKFTGLMFAAVLGLAYLMFLGRRMIPSPRHRIQRGEGLTVLSWRLKNNWLSSAGLALFAIFLLWNPYVSNLSLGKPPLFPAVGSGRLENLISDQTTEDFYSLNPIHKLFLSMFSRSAMLGPESDPTLPELKIPFVVSSDEVLTFALVDTRIGGWGPLLGALVVLGFLGLLAFLATNKGGGGGAFWSLLIAVGVTVLANPESWWARFSPQVASIPIFAIGLWNVPTGPRMKVILTKTILASVLSLSLVNSALVGLPMVNNVSLSNSYMALQVDTLKANSSNAKVRWHKNTFNLEPFFSRQGVAWVIEDDDGFTGGLCTFIYEEKVCSD